MSRCRSSGPPPARSTPGNPYCTVLYCTVHCTVPRELSTLTFVTSSPLLPDPYEARMVEVRQSEVAGAEDGLFSRRAVAAGTVLAFYNGIRRPRPEVSSDWWIRGHVT